MSRAPERARRSRIARRLIVAALAAALALLAAGLWIPAKAALAQHLLEQAWLEARAGRADAKPWPWADTSPIARLSIPALRASWIVLSGASGRNLAFAPAHMDGSARPGETGVTVIAAHRDTHFRALEHIEPGMGIVLETPSGEKHVYLVTGYEIVDSRTAKVRLDAPTPTLLLSTCYPFDALTANGPLRFVVTAEAVL